MTTDRLALLAALDRAKQLEDRLADVLVMNEKMHQRVMQLEGQLRTVRNVAATSIEQRECASRDQTVSYEPKLDPRNEKNG